MYRYTMSYQITIKNSVHEILNELKGEGSYSDIIETLLKKNNMMPESRPSKPGITTSARPIKESAPDE